jgi:hypothetical protein
VLGLVRGAASGNTPQQQQKVQRPRPLCHQLQQQLLGTEVHHWRLQRQQQQEEG